MLFFVYYSITFILHSVEKYKLLVQLNWFFPVHFIHIPRSILELDVILKMNAFGRIQNNLFVFRERNSSDLSSIFRTAAEKLCAR